MITLSGEGIMSLKVNAMAGAMVIGIAIFAAYTLLEITFLLAGGEMTAFEFIVMNIKREGSW
jgi:hypothetical protein